MRLTILTAAAALALILITATHDAHLRKMEGPTYYSCSFTPDVLEGQGFSGKVSIRRYYFVNQHGMKYTLNNKEYRECKALPPKPATQELKDARKDNTALWWLAWASTLTFVLFALLLEEDEPAPRYTYRETLPPKRDVWAEAKAKLKAEQEKSRRAAFVRASRKAKKRAELEARTKANAERRKQAQKHR